MNKIIFLIVSVFITTYIWSSQLFSQTTQAEYNYITKGYKEQIASGLDMKKGYKLIDMGSSTLSKKMILSKKEKAVSCEFKGLVRQNESTPCAIMLIYKRTDKENGFVYYICIPSPKSSEEIWAQTESFLKDNLIDVDLLQAVTLALMQFSSKEAMH